MIVDTHAHVVSSDKIKHPLDAGDKGWSTKTTLDVEDYVKEMDKARGGADTLAQPAGTYAHDNSYQFASAARYWPRTAGGKTPETPETPASLL